MHRSIFTPPLCCAGTVHFTLCITPPACGSSVVGYCQRRRRPTEVDAAHQRPTGELVFVDSVFFLSLLHYTLCLPPRVALPSLSTVGEIFCFCTLHFAAATLHATRSWLCRRLLNCRRCCSERDFLLFCCSLLLLQLLRFQRSTKEWACPEMTSHFIAWEDNQSPITNKQGEARKGKRFRKVSSSLFGSEWKHA